MINFSVKPSSYTGASDTNGGGYVDGYDATYANFCTANGGPLYTNIEPTTYGYDSTGLYDITHSMTVPTGVICYCRYADDSASTTLYFYAYLVNADNWQMVYLPVGKTGISSQAVIDDAISNAEAGDELLLLAVGGALATIEAGAELAKTGLANEMVETGTYIRTATVTDIIDLTIFGVDSDGNLAYGNDRFQEDLATNAIAHGYQYSTTTNSKIRYYNASPELYSVSGTPTSLVLYTASVSYNTKIDDVYVRNTGGRNSTYVLYGNGTPQGEVGNVNRLTTDAIYRAYYTRNTSVNVPASINSIIDATEYSYGIYGQGAGRANSCIIFCSKLLTNVRGQGSTFINCLIIAQNSTDDLLSALDSGYSYNVYFDNCIFVGFDELFAAVPDTEEELMKNCTFYNVGSIGNTTNNIYQGNFTLSADPFVDSANGDYRLNPAGPDFAKLYDTTTGRVLIGATGPELTTGTGGTGVCNLIGNGGMIE